VKTAAAAAELSQHLSPTARVLHYNTSSTLTAKWSSNNNDEIGVPTHTFVPSHLWGGSKLPALRPHGVPTLFKEKNLGVFQSNFRIFQELSVIVHN